MAGKNPEIPKIPPIEELKSELAREKAKYGFRKSLWNVAVGLVVAAAVTALVATRLLVLIRIEAIPIMEISGSGSMCRPATWKGISPRR